MDAEKNMASRLLVSPSKDLADIPILQLRNQAFGDLRAACL
jgi:hypothetical protein